MLGGNGGKRRRFLTGAGLTLEAGSTLCTAVRLTVLPTVREHPSRALGHVTLAGCAWHAMSSNGLRQLKVV